MHGDERSVSKSNAVSRLRWIVLAGLSSGMPVLRRLRSVDLWLIIPL